MKKPYKLAVNLLGEFACELDNNSIAPSISRKTRAVLGYLAATNKPHSRRSLYNRFCHTANDPAGTLRWHLSRIRNYLIPDILITSTDLIQFNDKIGWTDSVFFQTQLDRNLKNVDLDDLIKTMKLYRGEFLVGLSLPDSPEFELWLLAKRMRFQQLYERGLIVIIEQQIANKDYTNAMKWAQQLLQTNPLLEIAHAKAIWLYAQTGQRQAALEQFDSCYNLLQQELAVEPTDELLKLHKQILAGNLHPLIVKDTTELPRISVTDDINQLFLIGRDEELIILNQAWNRSQEQSTIVLIEGGAGGGKTRLVEEFHKQSLRGLLLKGNCFESSKNMPYRPWVDILQTRLDQLDDDMLLKLPSYWIEQLSRLLPTLALRLDFSPLQTSSMSTGEKDHLFSAVTELLIGIPDTPAFAIFIDDLQWADDISLELFHFVAHRSNRMASTPLLLLGAFRSEEIDNNSKLLEVVHDLRRTEMLHQIKLQFLNADHIELMITQLWPDLPSGYRTPHIRDLLLEQTGGNPLFITEILNELRQSDELPSTLPIPPSLDELIQRRLRQLSASGKQVLEALAVLDKPSTLIEAQQCSSRSEDETVMAIDQGIQWGILQAVADQHPPHYDFKHDLIRDAIIRRLNQVRRQRLHGRAAYTLTESSGSATLAYHWHMAGDIVKEGYYVTQAGEEALAVYANDEAIRYLERALDLISDTHRRAQLLLKLGDILQLKGEWSAAENNYQVALDISADFDDGQVVSRIQLQLGWIKFDEGNITEAIQLFEQSLDGFTSASDSKGMGDALNGLGQVELHMGHYDNALAYFNRHLDVSRSSKDDSGAGKALANIGLLYIFRSDHLKAVDYMERSLQMLLDTDNLYAAATLLGNLAAIYQTELYDYDKAIAYREQGVQICTQIGDLSGMAIALGNNSALYFDLGNNKKAFDQALLELKLNIDMGNKLNVSVGLSHIAKVFVKQGQDQDAEAIIKYAIALGEVVGAPYHLCQNLYDLAKLLFTQQRYTEAIEFNNTAISSALESGRHQVEVNARILAIQLDLATSKVDTTESLKQLLELLETATQKREQAAIYYAIAELQDENIETALYRETAMTLFHELYEETQFIKYYEDYQQLTDNSLAQKPIPSLETSLETSFSSYESIDLETLLQSVEKMLTDTG